MDNIVVDAEVSPVQTSCRDSGSYCPLAAPTHLIVSVSAAPMQARPTTIHVT
jgi:uncharacterized protein YcgI (DUF1989 family)